MSNQSEVRGATTIELSDTMTIRDADLLAFSSEVDAAVDAMGRGEPPRLLAFGNLGQKLSGLLAAGAMITGLHVSKGSRRTGKPGLSVQITATVIQ